jgi:hypothetical protein
MEKNFIVYIKHDFKITEQSAIRKALGIENKLPYAFLKPLKPIAMYRFNGDQLPKTKSLNDLFEVGKEYPVYHDLDRNQFVITNEGTPRKMMLGAWKFSKTL